MPVFSAARDGGLLRSSTAFRITVLKPSIPYFAKNYLDLDRREQQNCDTTNRNPGTLSFDRYLRQKRTDKYFCFLHEASQLFTR
ncbi:hypothetical protein TNCV_2393251 [Trichonephila clavipes]|nr:hypothetical protein TNCV_2393251 [Trichonephila clavipes]